MTFTPARPVLVASGCGGTGRELAAYDGLDGLGGFVTRTLTLDPRPGHPGPRVLESPSGFVHGTGLQNPGLDSFLARELPWLAAQGIPTYVSLTAATLGEYAGLGRRLGTAPGVTGVELNLVPPDLPVGEVYDAREPFQAARVVGTVRASLPPGCVLLAKLGADPARLLETARAVHEAGADAVVLLHALPASFDDGRPAGLGGPALRPMALRAVHEVRAALPDLPVIASGGAVDVDDVRVFLAAGAVGVQIGSALLHDPTAAARAVAALEEETP